MPSVFEVKRLSEDAVIPAYQTPGSAGADLHAAEDVDLRPGEWKAVGTGLAFAIPEGYEVQIRPRSGLAFKHGVTVLNAPGTIDSDYRGEVRAILINNGSQVFRISKGDRVAQMVLAEVWQTGFHQVEELSETERGEGGFGSTGR
jgi:dUTP pyrophosphatase